LKKRTGKKRKNRRGGTDAERIKGSKREEKANYLGP